MSHPEERGKKGKRGALIRVYGRVQGVFYRAFVKRSVVAKFPRISGYVRNMPDGSVEIFAYGPEDEIKQFIEFIRNNKPPLARVERVKVENAEREWEGGFEIV